MAWNNWVISRLKLMKMDLAKSCTIKMIINIWIIKIMAKLIEMIKKS
jgi:hypothetical protein